MAKAPEETLLERERFEPKSSGGLLSYEVWGFREKGKTVVTRYSLAYVKHEIFQGDNGTGCSVSTMRTDTTTDITWARSNRSSS